MCCGRQSRCMFHNGIHLKKPNKKQSDVVLPPKVGLSNNCPMRNVHGVIPQFRRINRRITNELTLSMHFSQKKLSFEIQSYHLKLKLFCLQNMNSFLQPKFLNNFYQPTFDAHTGHNALLRCFFFKQNNYIYEQLNTRHFLTHKVFLHELASCQYRRLSNLMPYDSELNTLPLSYQQVLTTHCCVLGKDT